jgi:hypothetical protein
VVNRQWLSCLAASHTHRLVPLLVPNKLERAEERRAWRTSDSDHHGPAFERGPAQASRRVDDWTSSACPMLELVQLTLLVASRHSPMAGTRPQCVPHLSTRRVDASHVN